ncbi:hypothetical protein [Cytophaga hutchinsonii]|uniref:Uncharacterized protein n=1 Tax=Cytophaga hutchinsonii (strain ATCC 33406 / DSM 1761 / CIP 103989 / NBRC 15051 / NCIMB 9469 / D465) TaxID=269798 RepID=A0A6N4SNZ1_CYTH3|nr:hypothetical protein [Cytophaga hutchinsonii]ABG58025.1 hypothetical protein CHU_0738 [Cytophaga hutchinsonii ATCC 33406]SFX11712.1 hypothetical protein SAMN04487930_101577 [Cytophaga hutchinsonii ATCC 33406]
MFKKLSFFIITSIAVFILTKATMEVESPSDGKDTYGYPLRFYTATEVDYILVSAAGLGLVYI